MEVLLKLNNEYLIVLYAFWAFGNEITRSNQTVLFDSFCRIDSNRLLPVPMHSLTDAYVSQMYNCGIHLGSSCRFLWSYSIIIDGIIHPTLSEWVSEYAVQAYTTPDSALSYLNPRSDRIDYTVACFI